MNEQSPIVQLKGMLSNQVRSRKDIDDFLIQLGECIDTLNNDERDYMVRMLQFIVDHAQRVKEKQLASLHEACRSVGSTVW